MLRPLYPVEPTIPTLHQAPGAVLHLYSLGNTAINQLYSIQCIVYSVCILECFTKSTFQQKKIRETRHANI